MGWILVAVWGVVLVAQAWMLGVWMRRISAQVATLALALRDVHDRLQELIDARPPE